MILNNELDNFLKNINGLTLVYGPSASGKSTLAMQTSLEISKKSKVLFFDTEKSFSIDRIKLMNPNYEKLLENIIVMNVISFEDQIKKLKDIEKLVKIGNFNYVVIDSFGIFYRHALPNLGYKEVNKKTIEILKGLKHVVDLGVPVLITNQVYSDFDNRDQVKMVGGDLLKYGSKCLIEVKAFANCRGLILRKHRSLPEGLEAKFKIIGDGIEEVR